MKNKLKILYDDKPAFIALITFIILLISFIPIYYVSFYAHPVYDDFIYGAMLHNSITSGGNIFDWFKAIFQTVGKFYIEWQGTFSAIFIFAIQPGVFHEDLYFLTTFIISIALYFSTFLIIDAVVVNIFEARKSYSFLAATLVVFTSFQFVPNLAQALYWWNGNSYYSLFYSFALIELALLIKYYFSKNKKRDRKLFFTMFFLSILIGGGNYSTALCTSVILALACIFMFIKKSNKKLYVIILFLALIVSLGISMIAPGNNVRAEQEYGSSVVSAIIKSIFKAFSYLSEWTGLPQIVLFIVLAIISLIITQNSKYNFRFPFVVVILSFLVFATQITPPMYAMSREGGDRQINMYYYSYLLFVALNILYICGWINNELAKRNIKLELDLNKISYKKICEFSFILIFLFLSGAFYFMNTVNYPASIGTSLAIIDGSAKQYGKEYKEIVSNIKNGENVVDNIVTIPYFYRNFDISYNKDYWINKSIADYFNVDYITLDPDCPVVSQEW